MAAAAFAPSMFMTAASSTAAAYATDQLAEARDALHEPFSLDHGLRAARAKLREVFEECRRPGWDGYGAEAVSARTYLSTDSVLQALPADIPMPTVGAEPDGHLTLEWYTNPSRVLSVSVSPEGDLHYAALLGEISRHSGTESFLGEIPGDLLRVIQRLFPG